MTGRPGEGGAAGAGSSATSSSSASADVLSRRPVVVVAPDTFKGSLSAAEVTSAVVDGLRAVVPDVEVRAVPVADGGDGTLEAVLAAGYRRVGVRVTGPTGEPLDAAYAVRDGTAVVEMALASGLTVLPGGRLAPLSATSRGTGELVGAALDAGCREVVLGVGGSACTDGGAGLLEGLGVALSDAGGRAVRAGGAALADVVAVDVGGLHPRVRECRVVLASDVDNPLLGDDGAAAVYGPQKGATRQDVDRLEVALTHWVEVLEGALRHDVAEVARRPGAGAAGGVGFAALAVLGAEQRPGADVLLDLADLGSHLRGADLVVTGEGSLDAQTLSGKAPAAVAARAVAAGVPCVAVVGRCVLGPPELERAGVRAAYALTDLEPDEERSVARADELLRRLGERVAREWVVPGSRG